MSKDQIIGRLNERIAELEAALANSHNRHEYKAPPGMVFVTAKTLEKSRVEELESALKLAKSKFDAINADFDRMENERNEARAVARSLRKQVAELEELIERLRIPAGNHTHKCIKCGYAYTPLAGECENCPSCGHDGSAIAEKGE